MAQITMVRSTDDSAIRLDNAEILVNQFLDQAIAHSWRSGETHYIEINDQAMRQRHGTEILRQITISETVEIGAQALYTPTDTVDNLQRWVISPISWGSVRPGKFGGSIEPMIGVSIKLRSGSQQRNIMLNAINGRV